jgi:hypothetical protein
MRWLRKYKSTKSKDIFNQQTCKSKGITTPVFRHHAINVFKKCEDRSHPRNNIKQNKK